MKNLKKLISVIIAVIMLVSSFATVAAADYADVESTNSYYKAIKVLSGLGIAKGDGENFNPANDVKRSEMVAFVCRAMGEEDIATASASNAFTDVAANHWAAGYIAWGVNRGIINGMGDGTFAPDASVTYQDAVVMIMRALGYDRIAQRAENGGYPTGYLKLASQYGVLKDAGYDNAKAATREIIAQLIYNALTAPLVDVSYYGVSVEDDKYVIYNGKNGYDLRTLLTFSNDIIKVKAEIISVPKADTTLIDKAGNEMVEIEVIDTYDYNYASVATELGAVDGIDADSYAEVAVYAGATEAADLLGSTVEAYVAEDEELNDWKLLAIVVDGKTTATETITENFDTIDNTTDSTIVAYKENRTDRYATEIEIAASPEIFYNGKKLASGYGNYGSLELMLKAASKIEFMGTKNKPYDKIFVTEYVYKVVDSVKVEDEIIKFKPSSSLDLSTEVRGDDFIYNLFDANGNAITLEDVAEGNVLNIVAPIVTVGDDIHNVSYLDIYVTNETIEGSVSEYMSSVAKYVIDGEKYTNATGGTIEAGDTGVFFISIDGKIVLKDTTSVVSKNFAVILAAEGETKFGTTTYQVKLLTEDGKVATYPVAASLKTYTADTLTVKKTSDGTQASYFAGLEAAALENKFSVNDTIDNEAVEEITPAVGLTPAVNTTADNKVTNTVEAKYYAMKKAEDSAEKRFISYKLNANGELAEIRTTDDSAKIAQDYNATHDYDADFATLGAYDIADAKMFVAPFKAVEVAAVNTTPAYCEVIIDEDKVDIIDISTLDEKETYDAYLYALDTDDETLVAAFSTKKPAYGLQEAPFAVVAAVSDALDNDDTPVKKYTFVQGGEIVELKADADYAHTTLGVGDVVLYVTNTENEIKEIQMVYDASNKDLDNTLAAQTVSDNADKYAYVTGIVAQFGDAITLATTFDAQGKATDGVKFRYVDGDFTYAKYDATLSAGAEVSAIKVDSIKETIRPTLAYMVVAKVNDNERIEDMVMVVIENSNAWWTGDNAATTPAVEVAVGTGYDLDLTK